MKATGIYPFIRRPGLLRRSNHRRTNYRKLTLAALAIFLFMHAPRGLALDHAGIIGSDETWYAADNPHNVVDDVTVDTGATLTLEDGVQVHFSDNKSLYFYGNLIAVGTPGGGILITHDLPVSSYVLRFLGDGVGTIEYCTIDRASLGIQVNTTGTVAVAHTVIQDSSFGTGIRIDAGAIELTSVTVTGCYTGLSGYGLTPTLLDENTVFENNHTGFYLSDLPGLSFTAPVTIRDNTHVGIHIVDCETPLLDNLILTGNAGYGAVLMQNTGDFTLGAGNTIGGPGLENIWPLSIDMGAYPGAGCVIPATGNQNNEIMISGGSSNRTGVWRLFSGLDYLLDGYVTIDVGGSLTIEDGVRVLMSDNRSIEIHGSLVAVGTSGIGIRFYGIGPYWSNMLRFLGDGNGALEHCTIEQTAGIYVHTSGTVAVANTTIQDCFTHGINAHAGNIELSSVTITGCHTGFSGDGVIPILLDENIVFASNVTGIQLSNVPGLSFTAPVTIRDNTTAGIQIINCETPLLDNLTLTGNTGDGAIWMQNTGDFTLGAGNTIGGAGLENSWPVSFDLGAYPSAGCVIPTTGNQNNDISVTGGASDRIGIWRLFDDLDYVVGANATIAAGGSLTIEDGVRVLLETFRSIDVYGNLMAIGTPEHGILFPHDDIYVSYGLLFAGDGTGSLDCCSIEGANTGIRLNTTGAVSVVRTTISGCYTGVHAVSGSVTFLNSTIVDNVSYGIRLAGATPQFGSSALEWNDIYGNGQDFRGRNLSNGETDIEAHHVYWGSTDLAEILWGVWDRRDDHTLGLVSVVPFVDAEHNEVFVSVDPEPEGTVPTHFVLFQNTPNPCNPRTTIRYSLPEPASATLRIFDVAGRLVDALVEGEEMAAGTHTITWTGRDASGRAMPSGTYFYCLEAGADVETRRMTLIR